VLAVILLVTLLIGAFSGGLTYLIVYAHREILWSSFGYLIGLILGLAATIVWATALESQPPRQSSLIGLGFVGALVGPAVAILVAWLRKTASSSTSR
jgi:hypothetical protein